MATTTTSLSLSSSSSASASTAAVIPPVKYIIHLSDIHIQLYKRHKEYIEQFAKLYCEIAKIKEQYGETAVIIVLTGDLLHSKSDLSPECITVAYNFIKGLAALLPLILIPGNHDVNMNNKDRLDSITPILGDLAQYYPVYYLLKSQVFQYSNLYFYHSSIFDYIIKDPATIDISCSSTAAHPPRRIALFHGAITGVELFHGMTLPNGEKDTSTNKTITPSSFSGYDLVLLGDIHKMQFIQPHIAYAGSLIQQNHGETISEHGFILWDVNACIGTHKHIPNNYAYASLTLSTTAAAVPTGSHICDTDSSSDTATITECTSLPHYLRLRILYTNGMQPNNDYIKYLRQRHTILDFCYINNTTIRSGSTLSIDASSSDSSSGATDDNISAASDIYKIINPAVQNLFITEYLKDKTNLTDIEITAICTLNTQYNKKLSDSSVVSNDSSSINDISSSIDIVDSCSSSSGSGSGSSSSSGVRQNLATLTTTGVFALQTLEFSNLFCYGLHNKIEFAQMRGVVGIIAHNHMGKSSILDIILYALYDKITRKGTVKDIINNRCTAFSLKLTVHFNNWKYTIEKTGKKTARDTVTVNVQFWRISLLDGLRESLEQQTGTLTKQLISATFGHFNDMINTCFSVQNNSCAFIDAENTARKTELERILKLDFLAVLLAMISKEFTVTKGIYEHIGGKLPPAADILKETTTLATIATTITSSDVALLVLQSQLTELQSQTTQYAKYTAHQQQAQFILNQLHLHNIDELRALLAPSSEPLISGSISDITMQINTLTSADSESISTTAAGVSLASLNSEITTAKSEYSAQQQRIAKLRSELNTLQRQLKPLHTTGGDVDAVDAAGGAQSPTTVVRQQMELHWDKLVNMRHMLTDCTNVLTQQSTLISKRTTAEQELIVKRNTAASITTQLPFATLITSNAEAEQLSSSEIEKHATDSTLKFYSFLHSKTVDYIAACKYKPTKIYKTYNTAMRAQHISDYITASVMPLHEQHCQQVQLPQLHATIATLEQQIEQMDKHCMSSEQIEQLRTQQEQYRIDILALSSEYNIWKQDYNSCLSNSKVQQQIDEHLTTIAALESDTTQITHKLEELQTHIAKETALCDMRHRLDLLNAASAIVVELDKYNAANLEELEKQRQQLVSEIQKMTTELGKLRAQHGSLTHRIEQHRSNLKECTEMEKRKVQLEYLRNAVKQIPFMLFQKIAPLIEGRINEFLSNVAEFKISLDITETKIDMYLHRGGIMGDKLILINNASGYERFISSLAIRVALLEITNLPHVNFIAIDEGWSSFDSHNLSNISGIMNLLTHKFEFILTMSHIIAVKECCDIQLQINQNKEMYSSINYG